MANYIFESYADPQIGAELAFDPSVDTLTFNTGSANTIFFEDLATSLRVFHDGYYVDLLGTQYGDLSSSTLIFADGSLFIVGTLDNEMLDGAGTNDYIDGGLGDDTMTGGFGDDDYVVNSVGDVVVELDNGGNDTVRSLLGDYTIGATIENLLLLGTDPSNGTGNDLDNIVYASGGDNIINGGAGRDTASYQWVGNGVTVNLALLGAQNTGGAGTDTLISFENLTGSFFNDTLVGNGLNNVIQGLQGNDLLNGGAGADTMAGGAGNDIYIVDNVGDVVMEEQSGPDGGVDIIYSSLASTSMGGNIEQLRLTSTGTANAYGNGANNKIYAGSGDNLINGNVGNDTVSYQFATAGVQVRLDTSAAQNTRGSGMDTLLQIENLDGSNYADVLVGNALGNRLSGGLGNDVLNGLGGADTMIGGNGNDTYTVDTVGDLVIEQTPLTDGGTDTVQTNLSMYVLTDNVEMLRILGNGASTSIGNELDNTIFTGGGNNYIDGRGGYDTASYAYSTAGVTVSLGLAGAQATGGSGSDTLVDIEALTGSSFNDILTGGTGDNELRGSAGNDILVGGQGSDDLWGDAGADTFKFDTVGQSGVLEAERDTIHDFTSDDLIDLSGIDANSVTAGDQAFTFIGASAFSGTDASGQLRYDAASGLLYGSTDADADAEFSIEFSGLPTLVAEDFVL